MSRVTPGYLGSYPYPYPWKPVPVEAGMGRVRVYPWVSDLNTLYIYNIKIKYLIYKIIKHHRKRAYLLIFVGVGAVRWW
jgi:hypothetical protein